MVRIKEGSLSEGGRRERRMPNRAGELGEEYVLPPIRDA